MTTQLDRIDELSEQLYEAVEECGLISEEDAAAIAEALHNLGVAVWNARHQGDNERCNRWGTHWSPDDIMRQWKWKATT